jgi:septum formation protein
LYEITKVTFNELSDEAIHYYIDNYKPYDKAGAYGIQEWIGFIAVSKSKGPTPMGCLLTRFMII